MEQIKLDIVPAGITPTAHASQFDSGRSQRFNLYNQGAEYTLSGAETITMVVNGVEEPVANTSDNYVVWNIADGDCDEAGVIGCELRIVENDMLIGSKNFFLEVEMDPYDGTNIHIVELSGSLLTFETTLPEPLVSCKAEILASQPSGTPTPSTPLPITGYTGVNLSVCDNDEIAPYLRGCYLGTYGFIDLSNLSYIVENQYNRFRTTITNLKYVSAAVKANIILNGYTTNTANYFDSHSTEDLQITTDNNTNILYIRNLSCSTGDDLRSALSGKILLYELKTPSTPVITSTDFANILTSFNANGTTYPVSWQDEAGTVYGGNLDLTTGVLTVTHGEIDSYNGESINEPWLSSKDVYTEGGTPTTGAQVVYPLTMPVTYQLTPTQVRALVGVNNVWADTGDITIKYLAEA